MKVSDTQISKDKKNERTNERINQKSLVQINGSEMKEHREAKDFISKQIQRRAGVYVLFFLFLYVSLFFFYFIALANDFRSSVYASNENKKRMCYK